MAAEKKYLTTYVTPVYSLSVWKGGDAKLVKLSQTQFINHTRSDINLTNFVLEKSLHGCRIIIQVM